MGNLNKDPYAELGVSSTKEGVKTATKNMSKGLYPGAFCQIVRMSPNLPTEIVDNYVNVIHSDGVGTKSNTAYLAMMEGNDSFWSTVVQDALVMNTDDIGCVGAVNHININNHIARNANRINDDVLCKIIEGYTIFFNKMEKLGIHLYNTGGETADVGSYTTTVGIDVTASAVLSKDQVVDCSNIGPNEYIVGLGSYGKATYEEKENSGIRSNGLTLAINSLLSPYYRKYPEIMDGTIPEEKLFRGKYMLSDTLKGTSLTIAEALLSPTRTFLPLLKDILRNIEISGIIHNSGGGLTKCKNFGTNIIYIKDKLNTLNVPQIFKEIQKSSNIEDRYMYKTFNMGVGMEVYVKSLDDAKKIILYANAYDIPAGIIGHTIDSNGLDNDVVIP